MVRPPPSTDARSSTTGADHETITVLHVDDEPDFADMAAALLEREDDAMAVETATSADEGIERLAEGGVDCVVSDYDMPEQNGLEFLERVREDYPDLPFILFTGKGSEEIASEAVSAGVTDYIQKEPGADRYAVLANRIENAVAKRRAETNYREIFEKAADGIVVHHPQTGEILDVNRPFCEMLGYSREELCSMTVGDFSLGEEPYTQAEARRRIQQASTEGPQVFEWVDETKDGDRLPVEVHLKRTTISGRERVLAIVRDVSERRERERELERTTRRLETIFEASPDAVFVHDVDGTLLEVNQRACEMLGYDYDELVGKTVWDLSADPDRDSVRARWREMSPDETTSFDGVHERADGSTFPVEVRVARVGVGDDPQFVAIVRDVTDHVERENRLRRKNERLEEFASIVSHDLRNPLNVLQGSLDLAEETGATDHFDRCRRAADRMEVLIDDLLALARQGETSAEQERVELAWVVEACWRNVETADATLRVETNATIRADQSRFKQLLENLVHNAVEHAGEAVTVTVGPLDDGFYVEDDGPGIPAAERERVFEVGYSTTEAGTGFGLSIVEQVADAHGWDVRVTEGTDGGARFEITGVEFD